MFEKLPSKNRHRKIRCLTPVCEKLSHINTVVCALILHHPPLKLFSHPVETIDFLLSDRGHYLFKQLGRLRCTKVDYGFSV